jgi:hypothetical protein
MSRLPDMFARLAREDERAARAARPTIEEMREKYGPAWGLKSIGAVERALGIDDERERESQRALLAQHASDTATRAILAEYARMKLEPVIASDGTLISLALLRSLGRVPAPEQPR